MAIRRAKRKTNFTIISNVGLRDSELSLKAKGLLAYMLSLPDDWIFYESELVKHSMDGKASVRSGLRELEEKGYLIKQQERSSDGKFQNVDWVLHDEPWTGFRSTDKRSTGKRSTDNRTLLSTNELSTNELSTNKKNSSKQVSSNTLSEDFEKLWKLYPKKTGKKKAFTSYKRVIKKGVTNKEIQTGIVKYKKYLSQNEWLQPADGSTWFNNERWEDEFQIENDQQTPSKYDNTNWEEKLKQEGLM